MNSNLNSNISSNINSNLDNKSNLNSNCNLNSNLDNKLNSNISSNCNLNSNLYSNLDSNISSNCNLNSNLYSNLDSNISSNKFGSKSQKKEEERFKFLIDIRDENGIRKGEPNYDGSTLYISDEDYEKLTPFEKQFWEIKRKHFDTVIMFKKGAFYELYEDDADLTSRLFDFKISGRVNMRMTGFPEKSFDQWVSKLLALGYKVGRVEQAENMVGKKIREQETMNEKKKKHDINKSLDIDDIKTGQNNSIGFNISKASNPCKDKIIKRELKEILTSGTVYNGDYLTDVSPVYLCVLLGDEVMGYHAMLYDASVNRIYYRSLNSEELGGLFVQHDIREIVTDVRVGRLCSLRPIKPDKREIASRRKYELKNDWEYKCYVCLYNYMDSLCRAEAIEMAEVCGLIDSGNMVLDGATITNLDILRNNYDGTAKGSLYGRINHCSTAFGERILRKWVVCPLTNLDMIERRRMYAEIFMEMDTTELVSALRRIGDTERILGKLTNLNPSLGDLKKFLESISNMARFLRILERIKGYKEEYKTGHDGKYAVKQISDKDDINHKEEQADNLNSDSHFFDSSNEFNFRTVSDRAIFIEKFLKRFSMMYRVDTTIMPGEANEEYARLRELHMSIEKNLETYLDNLRAKTGIGSLIYRNINREIFQIEAPLESKLPMEFYVVSSTKNTRRYYSTDLRAMVQKFQESEERLFQYKESVFREAVSFIEPYRNAINSIISFVGTIDCYISFAIFSKLYECTRVRFITEDKGIAKINKDIKKEEIISTEGKRKINLVGFRNPIYPEHIANDFHPHYRITLISGPNMGGKSTFLRSICLNIILGQIGMNVFCDSMEIPVFDKIFTRIGAADSLARGESTFMQEMLEASRILRKSSDKSFVVMDELGRGTSTQDGNAIARAVLDELVSINCHVLFSTHYHDLVRDYSLANKIYMDCLIDNKDIVFLYKAIAGIATDSHGLHVAKMAGIPVKIVDRAFEIRKNYLRKANGN